jgi:primosomal replication protein N''
MTHRLSQLTAQLHHWKQQAKLIDQAHTINGPWFAPQVFDSDSRWLVPCIEETEQNLARILRLAQNPRSTTTQIEHLTERLFAQMEALQRVITHALESLRNESTSTHIETKLAETTSKAALQKQLTQHQEWEQRLRQLVLNKQYEFDHAPARYHKAALQALTVAQQRLARCQQAKSRIEAQLLSCHIP